MLRVMHGPLEWPADFALIRPPLSENLCAPCQNLEILRASGAPVRYPRCRDHEVDDLVSVTDGRPTR